jgi:hypothetical protein
MRNPVPLQGEELPKASKGEGIDALTKKALKAPTSKEAIATIDELGKYGWDAVDAIEEVVNQTRFEDVRAHGLLVIRDIKRDDTQF